MIDFEAAFDRCRDEYTKFERVENQLHPRPDICAFLLLDKLVPGEHDMVVGAGHDEIYLETDCARLSEVATDDDILTLARCGVRYAADSESLAMFV